MDTVQVQHSPEDEGGTRPVEQNDKWAGIDFVDSAEDVDYENKAPKRLTAAMLNAGELDNDSFPFKLHQASIRAGEPIIAQVRLINLTERSMLGQLAPNVRELVQRLFFSNSPTSRNGRKENARVRMEQTAKRVEDTAHAYGCAGFVSPRLVMTREEVRDPENEAWVGSIPLHDLTEFVRICEGDDQLAARRLEGFSRE